MFYKIFKIIKNFYCCFVFLYNNIFKVYWVYVFVKLNYGYYNYFDENIKCFIYY